MRQLARPGRRGRLLDATLARLPERLRPAVEMTGWTSGEFLASLEQPPGSPPVRRAGREAARRVNAMAGVLPVEAVVLARAITDTAPPAGEPVHPTLRSVLDTYLPESLRAYAASRSRGPNPAAEELLSAQLRLLHQVALEAYRADADADHVDLRIQDAFLRERFAALSPSTLSLVDPEADPAFADPPGEERRPDPAAATDPVNPSADPETNPVVHFAARRPTGRLTVRLALPRGHPCTLGAVLQTSDGAVRFRHTRSRRWLAQRRSTGFRAAQADLTLGVDLPGVRRLLLFAHSTARGEPTRCVLFVRDATSARTALPTLLANRRGAEVTAIASGYATQAGLVVRNESTLFPDLRSACTGFGYDTVTWLDADTPIV